MDRASANAASHRLSRRDLARRCEARERRVEFWGKATAKLDELGKRVAGYREKIETGLAASVPRPTPKRCGNITARSSAGSAALRRSRRSRAKFTSPASCSVRRHISQTERVLHRTAIGGATLVKIRFGADRSSAA